MFDSPEPLAQNSTVSNFTPDGTLSWLVAYAGPCGDPKCEIDGITGGHMRLYLIPMIGWLHALVNEPIGGVTITRLRLRPAIMSSAGMVVDYLEAVDKFKFIAVIRATDDAVATAKGIYQERFGDSLLLAETGMPAATN